MKIELLIVLLLAAAALWATLTIVGLDVSLVVESMIWIIEIVPI